MINNDRILDGLIIFYYNLNNKTLFIKHYYLFFIYKNIKQKKIQN